MGGKLLLKQNRQTFCGPAMTPVLGVYVAEKQTCAYQKVWARMFLEVFRIAPKWKQATYPQCING